MLSLSEGLDLLDRRAGMARMALLAFIAFSAIEIVAALAEFGGMVDLEEAELSLAGGAAGLAHLGYFLVMMATIVFVAMWIYRAHANLRAAGIEGLSITPGWAVGWYFVPFANFVMPFRAMRELWNESLGQADSYGDEADGRLKAWWGAWIVGNIASNIATRLTFMGGSEAAGHGGSDGYRIFADPGRGRLAASADRPDDQYGPTQRPDDGACLRLINPRRS